MKLRRFDKFLSFMFSCFDLEHCPCLKNQLLSNSLLTVLPMSTSC